MLIGQLDPLAASLIQSETRLLSRDLLLLSQMLLGKQRRLQVRVSSNKVDMKSEVIWKSKGIVKQSSKSVFKL